LRFSCTVLFVSTSQVIGCEDRRGNYLVCVRWSVKLHSNSKLAGEPTVSANLGDTLVCISSAAVWLVHNITGLICGSFSVRMTMYFLVEVSCLKFSSDLCGLVNFSQLLKKVDPKV